MKNVICYYHNRDLDGWCSGAIVRRFYETIKNTKIILEGWDYNLPVPNFNNYDTIIMCDISFPEKDMYKLREYEIKGKEIIWLDHHLSSIKKSKEYIYPYDKLNGIRSTNFAACELTWEYFFGGVHPKLVTYLGKYDSFRHKKEKNVEEIEAFQYASRSKINSLDTFKDEYLDFGPYTITNWIAEGKIILNYLKTDAKLKYESRLETKIGDLKICVINERHYNPSVFGINYIEDGYDALISFYRTDSKNWGFSIYSYKDGIDCSNIAGKYGGGGHKGAAGFVSDKIPFEFME